jgi:hypothetical protein
MYDTNTKSIMYEIGRRHNSVGAALSRADPDSATPDMSIPTSFTSSADFIGLAKKYSNFSGNWSSMDLAAVIERLAKAVAAQSVFGGVTTAAMRGGRDIDVTVLATTDKPITSSLGSVFIPRLVDAIRSQDIFAVLAAATNGAGSSVVTDLIHLDANSNSPKVPQCSGSRLAHACVEALRILGANYAANNAGEVFAYALTRGIHSVVSVVGHTDEAGYLRHVLRMSEFRVPYGGIHYSTDNYPGLPVLASISDRAVCGWVDAIALATAAIAAHCDPTCTRRGNAFPSVYTTFGPIEVGEVAETPAQPDDALHLAGEISADCPGFVQLYIGGLSKIFQLPHGPARVAETHLESAFSEAVGSKDRHVLFKTVAPWFWIEPTSLIPHNFLGTDAEVAGYGSLVTPGQEIDMAGFRGIEDVSNGSSDVGAYIVDMPNARSSGLLIHLNGHPLNGLGAIKVCQMEAEGVVLAGDQHRSGLSVGARHQNNHDLASYLWVRGQSAIPAPSEFLNTGGTLGLSAVHIEWDKDYQYATPVHLPSPHEMEDCTVKIRVSAPRGVAAAELRVVETTCQRARSQATFALAQTRRRARYYRSTHKEDMTYSASAPVLKKRIIVNVFQDGTPAEPGNALVGDRDFRRDVPVEVGPREGSQLSAGQIARGPTAATTMVLGTESGPKVQRGQMRGGGTSERQVRVARDDLATDMTPGGTETAGPVPEGGPV